MDVAIIGGGPSGLMAAITAAEDKNNRIFLFERQQRVGKKLSATGNGRCNITNTGACLNNYHGERPEFAETALSGFRPAEVIKWFEGYGLLTVEEYGGRVYPLSDSANSVVDVLRFAAEAAGVTVFASEPVLEAKKNGPVFLVKTENRELRADRLVIACGGCAGAKLGGVKDGYELLASFGHSRTKLFPALTRITTDSDYPRALKGVRADAELRLRAGNNVIARSRGELQFTDNGISGPASFDISRAAASSNSPMTVSINLFPDYSPDAIAEILLNRQNKLSTLACDDLMTGLLHNKLGRMIVKYSGVEKTDTIAGLKYRDLRRVAESCFNFTLKVKGVDSFDGAQVTAGGVKTSEFDPRTMESKRVPGLYACGEVLDIDADCGGYNLQWAWASGRLAGRLGK